MEVHVFDVEHGFCAGVTSPTGRLLMIDCGHNATTGWRPSTWVQHYGLAVQHLVISNLDEDHVSDLPALQPHILGFTTNWNVSPAWVRSAKARFGVGPGVSAALQMMESSPGPAAPVDWGMEIEYFCHPPSLFSDENSLSVVTFIQYGGVRMVFPGDLTRAAWQAFLSDRSFVSRLEATNIFVASHHGRESGYCAEVFQYCHPAVILISDKSIQYGTQQVDYSHHAAGITWNDTERRSTLTTRRDGTLTITPANAGFYIRAHG